MTEITATILDSIHLELSQPISFHKGKVISIFIPNVVEKNVDETENLWVEAGNKHFLAAYDEEDAIYDQT